MTASEAALRIAELIRAGYLAQSGRDVPGIGAVHLEDEFIVTAPVFAERSDVLAALKTEMGWP